MYIRQLFTLEGCLQNKGIEKSLKVDGYIYIYNDQPDIHFKNKMIRINFICNKYLLLKNSVKIILSVIIF